MARNLNKEAQGRSILKKFRPVRGLGKWRLKATSEAYKKAMEALEKADDIIRDAAFKQKSYLKDMKAYRSSQYGVRFAQVAAAFMREQELISRTVIKLENVYSEIAEEAGFDRNESITTVIDTQVKGSPPVREEQNVEEDIDIESEWEREDHPGWLGRKVEDLGAGVRRMPGVRGGGVFGDSEKATRKKEVAASVYSDELTKEAFIGNWYWGQTESGKKLKKSFDVVYNKLSVVFTKNVSTLKTLDEIRSVGDPGKYLSVCKAKNTHFADLSLVKQDPAFAESWEMFRKYLVQHDKSDNRSNQDGQQGGMISSSPSPKPEPKYTGTEYNDRIYRVLVSFNTPHTPTDIQYIWSVGYEDGMKHAAEDAPKQHWNIAENGGLDLPNLYKQKEGQKAFVEGYSAGYTEYVNSFENSAKKQSRQNLQLVPESHTDDEPKPKVLPRTDEDLGPATEQSPASVPEALVINEYLNFANKIIKQAEHGDLNGVMSSIAKYADILDEAGFEDEALKLTAVLEGFLDE